MMSSTSGIIYPANIHNMSNIYYLTAQFQNKCSLSSTGNSPVESPVGSPPLTFSEKSNSEYVANSTQSPTHTVLDNPQCSLKMELVWHGFFNNVFSFFKPHNHSWELIPVIDAPKEPGWVVYKDGAKVRFACEKCGKCWTSMKGRVTFWITLCVDEYNNGFGMVAFRLYGQSCDKCSDNAIHHAMWYKEEVEKVVTNVFLKTGELFYGFYSHYRIDTRRKGRPLKKHNGNLCQACMEGVCKNDANIEQFLYLQQYCNNVHKNNYL